ncbi:WS/DGAT/MGAT family O-acyltransferase [Parahaliea aestuarii]|uniref:diacylglycerol O-acyltransferase n=1 Tax=Parahaliea aestuarii TaxID=1852021 RepID=A0A5C8ZXT5_9GAMM|nr:wax ester/triacylglycerol synthase family O-acyltransferase [Parahaliea aestuarii]TXS93268.1 wax ester/triacylglycerol synthase family O-acyltransferase [Parahaliea aestuarii]
MRKIELADAGFLYMEKRQTPMHVGGLHLFTLPDGADGPEFLSELMEVLRTHEPYRKPFGEYVRQGRAGAIGPLYWEKDRNFDIDYHVRHSALPRPGRFRELFVLVSRLHSMLLDRNRPLWEMYLIEGLQNRQFALYMKMHHAATDGAGAMHMINAMYSKRQSARTRRSPLSLAAYEEYKAQRRIARQSKVLPKEAELRNVTEILRDQFDTTANLMGAFRRFGSAFIGRGDGLAVPWYQIPHTSLNTTVTGSRRFVAQSWDFDRIRAVCKAAEGTVNDIVLAMCGGALRRYLLAQDELPRHSLKAMTPVSLREENDLDSSNAIGFMVADLATHIDDPEQRLRRTQDSMRAGKALLHSLSRREAMLFMQITQVPALLASVVGLATRFPAFSTVISNVPGPQEQLYWNGARVDGMYPASIVFDGFAMNITLVSYNRQLHFGIVACRRSLPQVQRLIDYLEEALQELEVMVGINPPGTKKAAPRPRRRTARKSAAAADTAKKRSKAKVAGSKKATRPRAKRPVAES